MIDHDKGDRCTDLEPHGLDRPDVTFILGLEQLDHVHGHGGVSPVLYMDAPHGLFVFHGKVELILVPAGGLVLESVETVLLGVVVACTEDIVLVLFENAILGTMRKLGTLLVVPPMQRIPERRGHHQWECASREKKKNNPRVTRKWPCVYSPPFFAFFGSNSLTKKHEFPAFQAGATGHGPAFATTFAAEPASVFRPKCAGGRFPARTDADENVHGTAAVWVWRLGRWLHPRLSQHRRLPGMARPRRGNPDGRVCQG